MFKSATIRLTGWYLLILMSLSVMFSIAFYQSATVEIDRQLNHLQNRFQDFPNNLGPPLDLSNEDQLQESKDAATNLSIQLLYVNFFVLIFGGLGGYFLARRTLMPIEKAHEAETRFTSDASHELRTPLATMKTEIEVALKDKDTSNGELKEILSSNLEEVNKLTKLAEMLLDLSRIDNMKLKFSPINLNQLTVAIVKNYNKSDKRLKVFDSKQLFVSANEIAIGDLIKILIDNALKYSPEDSQIKINIKKQANNVTFEIINSGSGIESDKLPFIFDRFYRADSSRTGGSKKGYGLGLALAKNIVKLHKGSLSVSSAPGQNTSFKFQLPLYQQPKAKIKN